jgi:hypothetical protein
LTTWEKILRMKKMMMMLTMEKMPPHPLYLRLLLPHLRRLSRRKILWR